MTLDPRNDPTVSVVLCSYNGGDGVARCLAGLHRQTVLESLQIIVVDDGSTDDTAAVAEASGAEVIRHQENRGLSAARNTGVAAAIAPIVAFLDDDCIPHPDWAEHLLLAYADPAVAGVGGIVFAVAEDGLIGSYLHRNNPIRAIDFRAKGGIASRFAWLGTRRTPSDLPTERRDTWALVGANMSFRRSCLLDVSGFDPRFLRCADDVDVAHRLHLRFPERSLVLDPAVRVDHVFEATFADVLRRGRGYGRGAALMYWKWSARIPKVFPRPMLLALMGVAGLKFPPLWKMSVLAPIAMQPESIGAAIYDRAFTPLLDGYIKLGQESAELLGYVSGLFTYRAIDWSSPAVPDD